VEVFNYEIGELIYYITRNKSDLTLEFRFLFPEKKISKMTKKNKSNQNDVDKFKDFPLTEGPMKGGINKPPTVPRPAPPLPQGITKKGNQKEN
jgi:hypothetical protein